MVVSLSTKHATDWEWQAVEAQMERLRADGYLTKLRADPSGTSFWTITPSGERYLKALLRVEDERAIADAYPQESRTHGDATMETTGGWQHLKPLGEGGQSRVVLVRRRSRVEARAKFVEDVMTSNPWAPYLGTNPTEKADRVDRLARSLAEYAQPDLPSDLGALKLFKIPANPSEANEAIARLANEIAVLRQRRPGLVKFLDANEKDRWIVTELMPHGTLDGRPSHYKGNVLGALRAFRSLVANVAAFHKDGYVHRDIKPANVFIADDGQLVLGDFGIVFVPEQGERPTLTDERVGPRDYMPQWGDLGERLEKVHTNFDVYMLGKLLWCMVAGRLKLPREYFRRRLYDVTVLFPDDPNMHVINAILDKCVVEEPEQCLSSASDLLVLVDGYLRMIERGGQLLADGVPRPCHVCGHGQYRKAEPSAGAVGEHVVGFSLAGLPIKTSMFMCDNEACGHVAFFRAK